MSGDVHLPHQQEMTTLISQTWNTYKNASTPADKWQSEAKLTSIFTNMAQSPDKTALSSLKAVVLSEADTKELYAIATKFLLGADSAKDLDTNDLKPNKMHENLEIAFEMISGISDSNRKEAMRNLMHFLKSNSDKIDNKQFMELLQSSTIDKTSVLLHLPEFMKVVSPHIDKLPSDFKKDALQFLLQSFARGVTNGKEAWMDGFKNFLKQNTNFTQQMVDTVLLQQIEKGSMNLVEKYVNRPSIGQRAAMEQKVVLGPQVRTPQSKMAQEIISKLLKDINSLNIEFTYLESEDRFDCHINEGGKRLTYEDGKEVELGDMLRNVNFNHISLSEEEIKKFEEFLKSNNYSGKQPEPKNPYPTTGPEGALSLSEKDAINIYTTEAYSQMIQLMQGKVNDVIEGIPVMLPKGKKTGNQLLKSLLLTIGVSMQGLQKLPNYDSPPGPDGQKAKFLFRKEQKPQEIIDKRIESVKKGGTVSMETGFISTAAETPADGIIYKTRNIVTLFYREECVCKDISLLSNVPTEKEILLTPTQIQWKFHKEMHPIRLDSETGNVTTDTKHLFVAKAVTASTETPTIEQSVAFSRAAKPRPKKFKQP